MNGGLPDNDGTDRDASGDALTATPERRMVRASLLGDHEHVAKDGQRVQIWKRGAYLLARMRRDGRQYGVTLGSDSKTAGAELISLLANLGEGTFIPRSEAKLRGRARRRVPNATLHELADSYLAHVKKTKGRRTEETYQARLKPALEFSERQENLRKWGLARSLDHTFAIELRAFLGHRRISRNGRANSDQTTLMSPKSIRLCLETLNMLLTWAASPYVRMLPTEFVNPVSREILGPKPLKDPLRECWLPMEKRIQIVQLMDAWELTNLSTLLTLPTRCEDVAGAIISDFGLNKGTWRLGTRLGGNDFNKGKITVLLPLPEEIVEILNVAKGQRTDGPMFTPRTLRPRQQRPSFSSPEELRRLCDDQLSRARPRDVETDQDRKQVIRRVLRDCGAISTDVIHRSIRGLLTRAGIDRGTRTSELRSAVTTDLNRAGVRHLELRYLTLHSVSDILNHYTPLDPRGEMKKYFLYIQPLLDALAARMRQVLPC